MKNHLQTDVKPGVLFVLLAAVLSSGCQQTPDASHKVKPLVDKYVEVWNGGKLEELNSILAPGFVRHANMTPDLAGVEAIKKLISGFRTSYPDLKIVLNDEIYSSETASAVRWTLTGTNTGPGEMPPTGKAVTLWGVAVQHYANGKLSEEWVAFDNHSFLEQLGVAMMPAPASKPRK